MGVSTSDVIVVGGGVIGISIAFHLAEHGKRVCLIERRKPGAGATEKAGGMLAPLEEATGEGVWLDFAMESYRHFLPLLEKLAAAAPAVDFCLNDSGLVRLAMSPAEVAQLQARLDWQSAVGLQQTWVDRDDLLKLEPRLGPSCLGGIVTPQESIAPMAFCDAMLAAAGQQVVCREGDVVDLLHEGDQITGVVTSQGDRYLAQDVVLAGGAWSGGLAARLGLSIELVPVRGQIMTFAQPDPMIDRVWWGPGYMIPRGNSFLIGATVEEVGFDESVTEAGGASLITALQAMMPELGGLRPHCHVSGLRPQTPDGNPLIGALPGWRGGWMAAGHFRNGVLLAPGTGRWLAETIVGLPASIPTSVSTAFSPERLLTSLRT